MQGLGEYCLDQLVADRARCARARLIEKAAYPLGHEPLAPFADRLLGYADESRHLPVGASMAAVKDDPRAQRERAADAALTA